MKKINPLKLLSRPDKWYLGGGNRLIWTPPFPVWLDYPGFWDKAHYYNYEIEPVFTWTLLDGEGNEIPLRAVERKWDPSKLIVSLSPSFGHPPPESGEGKGVRVTETKCCLPNDVLASVIHIKNTSNRPRKLHLVAWTIQPSYPSQQTTWLMNVEVEKNKINFTKNIQRTQHSNIPLFHFDCSLAINRRVQSYAVQLSEGSVTQPHWKLTPFVEKFRKGQLPSEIKVSGVNEDGLVFMALHTSLELRAKSIEQIAVFFAVAPARVETSAHIHLVSKQKDPVKVSEQNWLDHYSNLPSFHCSDEYLTRYYYYRWYGLKLLTMNGDECNYKHPAVCEGIGYFRAPITYSAMCHMLENRWMHTPELAQGSLLTFIDNQRDDGGFRGYIDVNYYRQEMFYHANWGNSLLELHRIHPDVEYLRCVYDGLVKYVEYFDRERDPEGSGLYDIDNHYETGQEYMHRYIAVNPTADKDNWGEVFRLKGVDVTVYIYELKKALAQVAKLIGKGDEEVERWNHGMVEIKRAILQKMWDPEEELFFDVDPATGKRTNVKAAVCFYPYMTDIVSEFHVSGFKRHLFNPKEFWTPYPVPSSSADDEYFSAEPEWKGKRMNCPWNGRVWPMTNSHIAEALAQSAIRFNDGELRAKTVEFITKFIRMMFFRAEGASASGGDGDPTRPNCFEHYNPLTGEPSVYRGVDDYQHSWVNDLIIKYIAGVRSGDGCIIVDPFPFDIESLTLDEIIVQGHHLQVRRKGVEVRVWLNEKLADKSTIGNPITIPA